MQRAQHFFTKELSFFIKMTGFPVSHSALHRPYISFVDAVSCTSGKITTCFPPPPPSFCESGADGFFSAETRKKRLLPCQWPFGALIVMCDPVLFDFICSLFITVFLLICRKGRAKRWDIYLGWQRRPLSGTNYLRNELFPPKKLLFRVEWRLVTRKQKWFKENTFLTTSSLYMI